MEIRYNIDATPKQMGWGVTLISAFQQMLAIMAATLLVPMIVSGAGLPMDHSAALLGAGLGTIVYWLFTKRRSPVFLGSSFAFLGAMTACVGAGYGYWGLILGTAFAAIVYVIIALIVKKFSNLQIGKALLVTDVLIVLVGGLLASRTILFSSALGLLVKTFGIDCVIRCIKKTMSKREAEKQRAC